jgi:hypothetical protein
VVFVVVVRRRLEGELSNRWAIVANPLSTGKSFYCLDFRMVETEDRRAGKLLCTGESKRFPCTELVAFFALPDLGTAMLPV